jgi:pimeloyl-ACP methyl ester carboxylesterase
MATYVLIHGASDAFYWHRVIPLLEARGHDVVAPDLPIDDEKATFADYADTVVQAIGHRSGVILVAQSMGAYTAAIVCHRVPVELVVLVAPMIPAPGETPADWWSNTGQREAQRELDEREGRDPDATFDPRATFMHDVPDEVVVAVLDHGVPHQADAIFGHPWPLEAWPTVPTRVLVGRDDRLIPLDLARHLAETRLGVTPDELPGGHLLALGHPDALADWLESYREQQAQSA